MKDTLVYLVDDDEAVRDSLTWLLEGHDMTVESFDSAEKFLNVYNPNKLSILIVDIRMPGMSGIELQEVLNNQKAPIPIVFITGHGDVPMAVSTIRKGAMDFLEKPFNEKDLLNTLHKMIPLAKERMIEYTEKNQTDALLDRLTDRERQVLERIVAGRLNKQIADDLHISIKTVEAHRANLMEKLEVSNIAHLMKIALSK